MEEPARFGLDEVRAAVAQERAAGRQPYAVAWRRGSLELGLYAPHPRDDQGPHDQDELYVVTAGTGTFVRAGESFPIGRGDVLFVAAGVEHRFVDMSEDLELWVVFYGPEGGEVLGPEQVFD